MINILWYKLYLYLDCVRWLFGVFCIFTLYWTKHIIFILDYNL